jgi:hypothetical protein
MIFDTVQELHPGTAIPKPASRGAFTVKGLGMRRGEPALIYRIPNHRDPGRPYEKGITRSEFEQAYSELMTTGTFSSGWFRKNMEECAKHAPCNFTSLGGIFQLLGIAEYQRGTYVRTGLSATVR